MSHKPSVLRIFAGVVAVVSMSWLLWNIDAHASLIERNAGDTFAGIQTWLRPATVPDVRQSEMGGLEVIEIFECMCGYAAAQYGVSGWIGLWLVTFVVGGIPTAVLAHSTLAARERR